MRRGSSSTWEPYARKVSEGMNQFTGVPVEAMTSEELRYKRGGGCFVTYTKASFVTAAFFLGIILAGFLGSYIGSSLKRKVHDRLSLVTDETGDEEAAARTSVLAFVRPARYSIELTPVIAGNEVAKMKGRVVIEFRVDGADRLSELPLIAANITATRYRLSLANQGGDEVARTRGRRKRNIEGPPENGSTTPDTETTEMNTIVPTFDQMDLENRTLTYENVTGYPLGNETSYGSISKLSPMNDSSLPQRDKHNAKISDANYSVEPGEISKTNISTGKSNSMDIEISKYETDVDGGFHVIHLVTGIGPGNYILDIEYEVPVDGRVIYTANFTSPNDKHSVLGTRLRPIGVRQLVPLFDDVKFKSSFLLSITRPKEMMVLSNMPLENSTETSDNWVTDTFQETPLLTPYNLALVISNMRAISKIEVTGDKVPVTFWGDPTRGSDGFYVFDKVNTTLARFIEVFDVPYPLPKLDVFSLIPSVISDAASPGLVSLRDSLFYLTDQSPAVTKSKALKTLIRTLGEQWLGGVVNMNNWTDAWILEGSLLYLQHEIIKKIDSSSNFSHSFVADTQFIAMDEDGYSISRPLQWKLGAQYYLDFASLDERNGKGACLIRMLHGAISDTAFRNGYKNLITRWQNETLALSTVLDILAEQAGELPEDVSMKEMFTTWISQSGYPVVTVNRTYEKGTAKIAQLKFNYDELPSDGATQQSWYIPLTYIGKHDDWANPRRIWLKSKEKIVSDVGRPDERSWILFNINKTGYYRVHYDEDNWKLLASALEENHEIFPAETRASLLDDLFSLAAVGLTKYRTAFDFIKYMQMKERHYAPWRTLMRHATKLNNIVYVTSAFTSFQEFMAALVTPLYSEESFKLQEGTELTLTAVQMACAFEHPRCLAWANRQFAELKNRTIADDSAPGYIRETIYCTIARYGAREEWAYFFEKAVTTDDGEEKSRLLSSFGCFQVPWILQTILNGIVHQNTFKDEDIKVILRSFSKNPAASRVAYTFVRGSWQVIVNRFSKHDVLMKYFISAMSSGLSTKQDVQDLQNFRENNYDSMKTVRYATAIVEAKASFVSAWLQKRFPEFENWLTTYSDLNVSRIAL